MELEDVEKIFEETNSKWEGDNALKGCKIIEKYFPDNVIQGAGHDVIWSVGIDEALEKISEEDFRELAMLNWMLDSESDCLSCFV